MFEFSLQSHRLYCMQANIEFKFKLESGIKSIKQPYAINLENQVKVLIFHQLTLALTTQVNSLTPQINFFMKCESQGTSQVTSAV